MDLFQLSLIIVSLTLGLGILAFWVWMLLDCIRYESNEGNDKIAWLLVIVVTKFIGALIYYFVRRPQRMRTS